MSTKPTLENCDREIMLRNAHRRITGRYRRVPLWAFIADICGVGSTGGTVICRELGWNPNADANKPLPRFGETAAQAATPAAR